MSDKDISSIRLKEARERRNIPLRKLSEMTGYSSSVLSRYENGEIDKIPIERLKIIAAALSVDPIWLAGFDVQIIDAQDFSLSDREKLMVETYRAADPRDQLRIDALIYEVSEATEKKAQNGTGNAVG